GTKYLLRCRLGVPSEMHATAAQLLMNPTPKARFRERDALSPGKDSPDSPPHGQGSDRAHRGSRETSLDRRSSGRSSRSAHSIAFTAGPAPINPGSKHPAT